VKRWWCWSPAYAYIVAVLSFGVWSQSRLALGAVLVAGAWLVVAHAQLLAARDEAVRSNVEQA
jgi:hypothetical protein